FEVKKGDLFVLLGLSVRVPSPLVLLLPLFLSPSSFSLFLSFPSLSPLSSSPLLSFLLPSLPLFFSLFSLFPPPPLFS
ncbi:hypothetical protein ACXWRS_12055, partial [Streptococcus pyogenes]